MELLDTIIPALPTPRVVTVTPGMAEQWLGKNDRNRNIRQALVDRYAADMAAGAWRFTGEAIKFSGAGRLLDGQHRLHAVVLGICGEVLPSLIIRRVPPAVLGYAYWRLMQVNPDDTERFFRSWSTMANLPEGSPILALHKRLNESDDSSRIKGVGRRKELLAAIFVAWNAWRKGEPRSIIKVSRRRDGSMSFPEPV